MKSMINYSLQNVLPSVVMLVTFSLLLSYLGSQTGYSQSEQNFTAPKFGISMQYPSDWTFVPEEQEFTPGTYDYSMVIAPGSAVLGDFCPTFMVGNEPNVLDCQTKGEVKLKITARKLNDGTTLSDFHERSIAKMEDSPLANLGGSTEYIDTNNIQVSGLEAIQTLSTCCEGGILDSGQDNRKSKDLTIYVVNGGTGYEIHADTDDEKDFDTYLPTFLKMIDSIQIK